MAQDLTLAMRLLLNAQQFVNGLNGSRTAVGKFVGGARAEFGRLQSAYQSVTGRIAALGVGVGATATIIQSAQLDKNLTQIGLTAGVGAGQIETLRNRLFALAQQSGKSVEDLMQGFNSLVQSGLSFDQSLATMTGINQAMAVTGADAQTLARGITVAARAFNFDLTNPRMATQILEKMTVAGRLGNAELEDLAGVFGRVGNAAAKSGMQFDETLALIEGLSLSLPGQPERLATRAESTLRLFTNMNYLKAAQKASNVAFFNPDGSRRNTTLVFEDLKKKFDRLGTDLQRANFIQKAFGMADLDTQTGIFEILSGGNLDQMKGFSGSLSASANLFEREMKTAIDNSVDQLGRLKSTLREAADGFAKPINESIAKLSKYALDSKQDGGLGLSGGQIAGIGVGALVSGYALKRVGGIVGNLAGTAGGIAAGKAAEAIAGVTPVFVTNWPGGSNGGIGALSGVAAGATAARVFGGWRAGAALLAASRLSALGSFGATGVAGAGGMLGAAGLAGYGVGSLFSGGFALSDKYFGTNINDNIGMAVAKALAAMGSSKARDAITSRDKFEGSLKIEVESREQTVRVRDMRTNSPSLNIDLDHRGPMMVLP